MCENGEENRTETVTFTHRNSEYNSGNCYQIITFYTSAHERGGKSRMKGRELWVKHGRAHE